MSHLSYICSPYTFKKSKFYCGILQTTKFSEIHTGWMFFFANRKLFLAFLYLQTLPDNLPIK